MEKDLEELREKLVKEVGTANAIAEFLILIHTGAYGFEHYDVNFEMVQNAFCLMADISEKHANKLEILTDDIANLQNDLKSK